MNARVQRLFPLVVLLAAASLTSGCTSKPAPPPVAKTKAGTTAPSTEQVPGESGETKAASPAESSGPAQPSEPVPPSGPVTEPAAGYVLIAPLRSTETYLINNDKQIVHRWTNLPPVAGSVYLLENGDLLRTERDPDYTHFRAGGVGGTVRRYTWDGELVWTYKYSDENRCLHHDVAVMPNGNILMIAWERKSKDEAMAQGRDPKLLREDLWPDHVIEVQPEGAEGGKIVWEWHMWDHLIQDFDREKPHYGIVYEHPELIDLNNTGATPPATAEELLKLRQSGYTSGGDDDNNQRRGNADWLHTNAINYNPQLDQIALSAKNFSEIWIIDHSTTTAEAASHRGGKSGKGGDLLYRWGNPWAYKSGTKDDKKLFDQHDVRWISPGLPGAGHLMAFNNGPGREYSSIIEIAPPLEADGNYTLDEDGRYGPKELFWEYTAENKKDFYSFFISGAMRLKNGNTMICEGATGRFFEVNREGQILWQLKNPYGGELTMEGRPNAVAEEARRLVDAKGDRPFVQNTALFRATKFSPDYPGLAGRKLEPLADQPVPFSDLVQTEVDKLKAAAAEKPADEKPAAEKPAAEKPAAEKPAADKPAADTP